MSRNKLINLAIVGGLVLVGLFGWILGISPVLDQTAAAKTQQVAMSAANDASAARLALMKSQFAKLPALKAQLDALSVSVPASAAMPEFLARIGALNASTGTRLVSVTAADAMAYIDPTATAAVAPTAAPATPAATPSPSASAAAGATAGSGTAASGASPAARLVTFPIAISVTGTYDQVMAFGGQVQVDSRLFLVRGSTIGEDPTTQLFTLTLTGSIFTLPSVVPAPTQTPAKTPAPTATPIPSPSVSASSTATPSATATPKASATAKP
jgi:Tfp pilus assembly protein PilO